MLQEWMKLHYAKQSGEKQQNNAAINCPANRADLVFYVNLAEEIKTQASTLAEKNEDLAKATPV